jgi:hypothetical protein
MTVVQGIRRIRKQGGPEVFSAGQISDLNNALKKSAAPLVDCLEIPNGE